MTTTRTHLRAQTTWIAVMDVVCLLVGGALALIMRIGPEDMHEYVFEHIDGWLVFFGSVILANYLAGSYKIQYTFSRFNLVVTWLFSLIFALLVLSITSYAWFRMLLGRGVLFLSVAWYSVISIVLKIIAYRGVFRSDVFLCRTVVIGSGPRAKGVRKTIESEWVLPAHKVVAYVDVVDNGDTQHHDTAIVDGVADVTVSMDKLADVIQSFGVNLIVLGLEDKATEKKLYPQLRRLRFQGVEVLTALGTAEIYQAKTPLDLIDEDYLMDASLQSGLPLVRRLKRLVDCITAMLAVILLLPFGLLIALAIKLSAPRSPVLYSQQRVGQFGEVFRIYKFRTMREGAEDATGAVWADRDDPRITRLGRFLRRFRLDEIPQFINVLKGEMSIVGPRPERPELIAEISAKIPYYNERANVMPGLTGWAQIRYPYGSTVEDAARKLEFDLYYIKHLSLSLDLQIILRTIRIVLFGKERSM